MKLSRRLVLLLLVSLAPMIAAQVYTQIDLRRQRQGSAQLGQIGLREVQLVNADMASIVGAARQVATVVAHAPALRDQPAACAQQLETLGMDLPRYRFIAVYDRSGAAVCASLPGLVAADARPAWLHDLATDGATDGATDLATDGATDGAAGVGRLATSPAVDGPFLPVGVRLPDHGWVVAALDLGWLSRHLDALKATGSHLFANGGLIVTDRAGDVLARYPASPGWAGQQVLADLKPLLSRQASGVTTVAGLDGGLDGGQDGLASPPGGPDDWLIAYSPAARSPAGIGSAAALYLPDFGAGIDAAIRRDAWVIAICAQLALVLAYMAGQRYLIQPTKALLAAVRRWQDGELDARADVPQRRTEFGALAESFNAMADTLQARDQERRLHAETLEARVAQRTSALSESNNRLQVEIAERERTEAALHQAQKLQAVGQLAGGIAHDFNNMLATILGSLELMERRLPQGGRPLTEADDSRLRNLIERATAAVQRGAHLTSGLLAFSRRQRLSPRPTDLNRLLGDLIALATSTLGRRIRVVTDLAADLWPAQVDPSQVEAAILNLCLNARDAMPEGGQLTITTANETIADRVGPDGPDAGAYVRICVTDTGGGMTPDVLRRAFDPFFTTKGPAGGPGLGLSQVYGMARQLGGTVRIRSAPGEGTAVALLLPRSAGLAGQEAVIHDAAPQRRAAPPCLVLVVDDDAAVRHVAVEMLKDLGCDVVEAPGGAEALALLEGPARQAGVALIDYAMPKMNGLQLARIVRDRLPELPLVLATGYAELGEESTALFDAMLRKPFTIRELEATLARMRELRPLSNVVPLRTQRRG